MDTRELTLLAYGIAEYDTALAHLRALRRVGHRVPYVTIQRITTEQTILCMRWQHEHGQVTFEQVDTVVSDARRYLTEHGDELGELTRREREADEQVRSADDGGGVD